MARGGWGEGWEGVAEKRQSAVWSKLKTDKPAMSRRAAFIYVTMSGNHRRATAGRLRAVRSYRRTFHEEEFCASSPRRVAFCAANVVAASPGKNLKRENASSLNVVRNGGINFEVPSLSSIDPVNWISPSDLNSAITRNRVHTNASFVFLNIIYWIIPNCIPRGKVAYYIKMWRVVLCN